MSTSTYSSKAAATKGAKRQNVDLTTHTIFKNYDSRWVWGENIVEGFACCPGCDIHLDNGVIEQEQQYDEVKAGHFRRSDMTIAQQLKQYRDETTNLYECMACGTQFGPELTITEEAPKPTVAPKGLYTIEKNRPEQNGIKRPSAGGKCRAIWDACDAVNADGTVPTPKIMKALAAEQGWNANNAVIEMYQWRKFNGITGRQA